jgi:hypothetical protein
MKGKAYLKRNQKELFIKATKSKARLIYEHKCKHCNCDFISNRKTAVYCSDSCKVSFYRKRDKILENIAKRKKYLELTEKALKTKYKKN